MRALSALTIANIRGFVRDRAAMFWTLAFPLIFIFLFGFIFQGSGGAGLDAANPHDPAIGQGDIERPALQARREIERHAHHLG